MPTGTSIKHRREGHSSSSSTQKEPPAQEGPSSVSRCTDTHRGHVSGWTSASLPCPLLEQAVPPQPSHGHSAGQAGTRAKGCWSKTIWLILCCAVSQAAFELDLAVTLLMLTISGSAGDFTAPKIEMCSQLLNPVQEKYSIPCLERVFCF